MTNNINIDKKNPCRSCSLNFLCESYEDCTFCANLLYIIKTPSPGFNKSGGFFVARANSVRSYMSTNFGDDPSFHHTEYGPSKAENRFFLYDLKKLSNSSADITSFSNNLSATLSKISILFCKITCAF